MIQMNEEDVKTARTSRFTEFLLNCKLLGKTHRLAMPCQWSESTPCPFSAPSDRFIEFGDRQYCPLHVPLGSPEKPNASDFAEQFRKLQEKGNTEFEGVTFPGAIAPNTARYDAWRNLNLTNCTYGDRTEVVSNAVDLDLSESQCVGTFGINVGSGGNDTICKSMTFQGKLTVDVSNQAGTLDFEGSAFLSTSQFNSVERARKLNFTNCDFTHPPGFAGNKDLPQKTNFRRAQFTLRAEDESAYRTIRNHFNTHRARDAEGRFYALEKRCQRRGMSHPREWVVRSISTLYDIACEYGQSYSRALLWFCVLQLAFALMYSLLSGRLTTLPARYDSHVVAFTFAQVVKPFELFSAKAPTAGAYAIIPDASSGWWLLLTATQSVLSITLITLFLLAIRWRFRRE